MCCRRSQAVEYAYGISRELLSHNETFFFGFYSMGRGDFQSFPIKNESDLKEALRKAVLMFCAAFGTIGSIASAFDMRVNYSVILVAFLVVSFVLSFLHYHRVLFNIGYPVAFVLFAVRPLYRKNAISAFYFAAAFCVYGSFVSEAQRPLFPQ